MSSGNSIVDLVGVIGRGYDAEIAGPLLRAIEVRPVSMDAPEYVLLYSQAALAATVREAASSMKASLDSLPSATGDMQRALGEMTQGLERTIDGQVTESLAAALDVGMVEATAMIRQLANDELRAANVLRSTAITSAVTDLRRATEEFVRSEQRLTVEQSESEELSLGANSPALWMYGVAGVLVVLAFFVGHLWRH